MKTWTPEAEDRLGHYLEAVLRLARSQGEQGDDFLEDLQAHIRSDAEENASGVVTVQNLDRALASAGTPYDVLGMDGPVGERGDQPFAGPTGTGAGRPSTVAEASASSHGSPQAPAPQVVVVREQRRSSRILTCAGVALILLVAIPFVLAILGTVAAILLPALARSREAARRASCQNNMKQMGIEFTGYADTHNGRFPSLAIEAPPFGLSKDVLAGIDPALLQCPSDPRGTETGGSDYIYLGYAVLDQEELDALVEALLSAGQDPGTFATIGVIAGPHGDIQPLAEGRSDASEVPVLVEWSHFHVPHGGNVLYLDGHTEFVKLGQKFPMTEEFFEAVGKLGLEEDDVDPAPH